MTAMGKCLYRRVLHAALMIIYNWSSIGSSFLYPWVSIPWRVLYRTLNARGMGTTADACDPSNQAIAPVASLIEQDSGSTAPQSSPRSPEALVVLTSTTYAHS
jgi:hypothetical protein